MYLVNRFLVFQYDFFLLKMGQYNLFKNPSIHGNMNFIIISQMTLLTHLNHNIFSPKVFIIPHSSAYLNSLLVEIRKLLYNSYSFYKLIVITNNQFKNKFFIRNEINPQIHIRKRIIQKKHDMHSLLQIVIVTYLIVFVSSRVVEGDKLFKIRFNFSSRLEKIKSFVKETSVSRRHGAPIKRPL